MTIFGAKLREARAAAGMSSADLARALGLSTMAVSNYETGKREPSYATLVRICDLLDVSADYLLGRNLDTPTKKEEPLQGVQLTVSPEVLEMARRFGEMLTQMTDDAIKQKK